MKTVIFRNADSSTIVTAKVDIHDENAALLTPEFVDTRFTAMEIDDNDAAIILGIDVTEIEHSISSLKVLASSIPGIGLFIVDQNSDSVDPVAQDEEVLLSGTSGSLEVNVDGVTYSAIFNTNLDTTAADFIGDHAANLSTAGITVTNPSGSILRFVADIDGVAFSLDIGAASADMAGVITSIILNQSADEITLVSPNHV